MNKDDFVSKEESSAMEVSNGKGSLAHPYPSKTTNEAQHKLTRRKIVLCNKEQVITHESLWTIPSQRKSPSATRKSCLKQQKINKFLLFVISKQQIFCSGSIEFNKFLLFCIPNYTNLHKFLCVNF